ncbi:Calmodulin-binding transcription activator 5 [Linum grandiflorum]
MFYLSCSFTAFRALEHIVLVHYRDTQVAVECSKSHDLCVLLTVQLQSSPVTPAYSNSSSVSNPSTPWLSAEQFDSGDGHAYSAVEKELTDPGTLTVNDHQLRIHAINTLEWDDLVSSDPNNLITFGDKSSYLNKQNQVAVNGAVNYHNASLPASNISEDDSSINQASGPYLNSGTTLSSAPDGTCHQIPNIQLNSSTPSIHYQAMGLDSSLENLINDGLHSQESFRRWNNDAMDKSGASIEDHLFEPSISSGDGSSASPAIGPGQYSTEGYSFVITDVSHAWAFSNETTKILVTGFFDEQSLHLANSSLVCVCGDDCVTTEVVQSGVYRCYLPPHSPGLVNLCLSLDGCKPLSQVLSFEYRDSANNGNDAVSKDESSMWERFHLQTRLAYLLLSTSKTLNLLSSKVSSSNLKDAEKFAIRTSNITRSWSYLFTLIDENRISLTQAKEDMYEITLKSILQEWLLERVVEGCSKSSEYDAEGQGVIHLCARLGYTWAIYLYSWSGLSLDFRDKHGWTALHWAAYYGREKMVAVLLSAGTKPNLVTDPTAENPGGRTPADVAAGRGHEGLAAYLSEKALVSHFKDMSIAGNVCGALRPTEPIIGAENLSEEEVYLKDTLSAYRTAADAASRIQEAFRERSMKLQAKVVESSNPEAEARSIVAAMKIQHAFRNYESKKKMAAVARIQHRFRTWKMRREFLTLRRHTIKIQAAFRGLRMRKHYSKILWSVGVVEKAVLRWRLKRKGFRGLIVTDDAIQVDQLQQQTSDTEEEEEFFKASRKQAEERVERAVVTVQAMFRSKKAQVEYQSMKSAYNQASLEYEGLKVFFPPNAE